MRLTSVPLLVVSWLMSEYVLASVGSGAVGNCRIVGASEGSACAARVNRLTVLTVPPALYVKMPLAACGIFTYNAGGTVRTVNLFTLAAQADPSLAPTIRQFPTAPDPTLAKTYSLINQLTTSSGTLVSRIATNNDYNRQNFTWNPKAVNNRKFQTARIDYNLTEKRTRGRRPPILPCSIP